MKSYILNRPVNALKKLYPPSYLGAKIRASKASDTLNKILELSIKKRLNSSENWSYKKFKVFKGVDGTTNKPEYRDYLAPSPSTAAAEAFILNGLSEELAFTRLKNVYSYIRSKNGSQYNYEYYLPNYQKRNSDILNSLNEHKGSVVLFLDIKNFYASVDKFELLSKIKKHEVLGDKKNSFALDFLINQLEQSPSGIPIGTELSHLLADVYLSSLDECLGKLLNSNYFRYVDDVTIVCRPDEVKLYEKFVSDHAASLGLSLNEKKREVFSASQWLNEMDTSPVAGGDFYSYCQMLGEWIDGDKERMSWLDCELKNEGFQIPLNKIFIRQGKSNKLFFEKTTEHNLIEKSKLMREKYLNALDDVSENLTNNSSRWYLQKTKRAINPLFYLLNKESYPIITATAKESYKLKTQEEVSSAIYSNACESIIKFPGVTINTFCEIWKTTQPSGSCIDNLFLEKLEAPELDSVTTLALYDILKPPVQVAESSIWQALRPNVKGRTESLNGFDAEIESLRIGVSEYDQQIFLDNRLTEDEDVFLSGLELGDQSIS